MSGFVIKKPTATIKVVGTGTLGNPIGQVSFITSTGGALLTIRRHLSPKEEKAYNKAIAQGLSHAIM